MWNFRKAIILIFIFFLFGTLHANPFLGSSEGPSSVRPPSRSVPRKLIEAQLQFKDKISELLGRWNEENSASEKIRVILPLLGFGFLYGILHALGPGHRKTVVFSLFLSRKTSPLEPLLAGFLSSFLHGFSAVGIIIAYRTLVARIFLQKVDDASVYLEGWTYLILALLALLLLIWEALHWKGAARTNRSELGLYSTISVASLFPCPIAVMILIFSITLDLFAVGVSTVIALSLGMGVVISGAGFMAKWGRDAFFHRLGSNEDRVRKIGKVLEMGSYFFLIMFSLWMALPFLDNFIQ